jgi:hypothetical protein
MKGKQVAILLVLVVVLGTAGYLLQKKNQSSWSDSARGPSGKIVDFPINDVTLLTIKNPGGEVNVVRKDDDWVIRERGDYPANYEQVGGLLRKLWDLKPVQQVKVGASQLPRLELVEPGKGEPGGTVIELKGKDGNGLGGFLLGKPYLKKADGGAPEMPGFPAGRYVMPVGSINKVSLVSETFEDVEAKPERWLRRDFIKIENPKSIALAGQTDGMHWTVTREMSTAEWKLVDAKPEEKLDTAKTGSFASAFSSASFKDVLAADAKPEETGLDKPATLTIETFDNFVYTLKIGKLTAESYPVLVSITANLAKERTPGKDEKPEDKTRLDEEFKTTSKRLEDKLGRGEKIRAARLPPGEVYH